MRTTPLTLLASCLITACAVETQAPEPIPPASTAEHGAALAESDLASAILSFVNSASYEQLDGLINASAASSIVSARPFINLETLAGAPYVTDTVLRALLGAVSPADASAGAGFWEERLLDATQAAAVLEMGNQAALTTLGCDLGFSSTMGQRIVDGRPYANLDQLVAVQYFGASQLLRLKDNVSWWTSADSSAASYDCVSFSAAQEAAALQVANSAGLSQLCDGAACGFGGWRPQVDAMIAGRPWSSLSAISAISGMGPARMGMLRTRADKVIAGTLALGADSVSSLLNGNISDGYTSVPVRFLTGPGAPGPAANAIGLFTHFACAEIADPADLTQQGVVCSGCWDSTFRDQWAGWAASGESVNLALRFYQDPTWGLVIYQGTCAWGGG